jgi:hypothetical protein
VGSGILLGQVVLFFGLPVAVYALTCAIWPYRLCRHCGGAGKKWSPMKGSYRRCSRCGGVGGRLRFGARFWSRHR